MEMSDAKWLVERTQEIDGGSHISDADMLRFEAIAERLEALEVAADALVNMVCQHCSSGNDRAEIDSMCLSANEDALEALEGLGLVRFSRPDSCRLADWVRVDDDAGEPAGGE